MVPEIKDSIVFIEGFVFHKNFVYSYKNMNVIQARRKLSKSYHRHMQDVIIRYLKEKGTIRG